MKKNKKTKTNENKVLSNINSFLNIFGLISIPGLYYGLTRLDNYKNWLLFPIILIIIAIIVANIAFKIVCKRIPEAKFYKDVGDTGILFKLIMICSVSFLWIGIMLNQNFILSAKPKSFIIEEKFISSDRRMVNTYYIRINGEFGKIKLNLGERFYSEHKIGDSVNLNIIKGIFGFEYYQINYQKQN
jgi:hypothetical protein